MSSKDYTVEDDPLWYKDAIIYELHVRAFCDSDGDGIGDFKGLIDKLDHLKDLGITAIWLLPFYPSPLRDDGYDVSDYYNIHSQYGTLSDFQHFLEEAHKKGLRVITELIINHTSDKHEWFQKSRRAPPNSDLRAFYVWSDTPQKYGEARIIFKDFESSNWAWDHTAKAHYWHRFYSHQPDLNYDNPLVQQSVLDIVDFWLQMGIDGLRLDAVPYLYEREGTNCENLPETHIFLKKLRIHIDRNFENRMLLAEANQWPEDSVAYFGNGDECHLAFHFPLMPRMFMAIQLEDRFPLIDIFDFTPPIPEKSQWALFLRNHDELTLEMVTDEERDYLYKMYAKDKQARINLGIRRRLAPLMGNDRRKIELMNVLLFTFPGTPVIYYGDEIGMGDNYHLGDRNGVRTPMQWNSDINSGFSKANPQRLYLPAIIDPEYHYEVINVENQQKNHSSILWWMRTLIALRKRFKAFGRGSMEFIYPENTKILAFIRSYKNERILVAVNISRRSQVAELDLSGHEGETPRDLFSSTTFPSVARQKYLLTFMPYGYYIFSLSAPSAVAPELPIIEVAKTTELFKGRNKDRLESEILPIFLKQQRWFGGKARKVDVTRFRELATIEADKGDQFHLAILDVYYDEGFPETYLLPLVYTSGEETKQIKEKAIRSIVTRVQIGETEGVLYDAVYNERFRNALPDFIGKQLKLRGMLGEFLGLRRDILRDNIEPPEVKLTSHLVGVEQSNTSIVYNEKSILKLFRRIEEGMNPELEIGDFLTKNSFQNTPKVLGDLRYVERGSEPVILGILQDYIKNSTDAWNLFLNEIDRFLRWSLSEKKTLPKWPGSMPELLDWNIREEISSAVGITFLENVGLLGRRTGEFHLTLASGDNSPDFSTESFTYLYQMALSHAMISYAKRVLQSIKSIMLSEDLKKELEEIIANKEIIFEKFKVLRRRKIDVVKTRIHGDYHLGQVLYTGNDFIIIDYEGEPARSLSERRLKRSPIRDIAGMIRSFHYASYAGLFRFEELKHEQIKTFKKTLDLWYKSCTAVFLSNYINTVKGSGIVPTDRDALSILLEAFLLEKAIYELGYEMNSRPDWALIPIQGIRDILGLNDTIAPEAIIKP